MEDSQQVAGILKEKGLVDNIVDAILADTTELRGQSIQIPAKAINVIKGLYFGWA